MVKVPPSTPIMVKVTLPTVTACVPKAEAETMKHIRSPCTLSRSASTSHTAHLFFPAGTCFPTSPLTLRRGVGSQVLPPSVLR